MLDSRLCPSVTQAQVEDAVFIGAAQTDITPAPGVELSGFAARTQPSTGVLDPLFAKAVYVVRGGERLLWVHCDLLEFDRDIVLTLRRWAESELDFPGSRVMLSATHTHSGPCTVRLKEAGAYDPGYVEKLNAKLRDVSQAAVNRTDRCEVVTAEAWCTLAQDRRGTATAHVDPRVAAVGLRRTDGTFAAVILNYAMHPVALGASNRSISADIPGRTAEVLSGMLPGKPIVLVTNGACGNLNPPAEDVSFSQIEVWGRQIAQVVGPLLLTARPCTQELRVRSLTLPLSLDALGIDGIKKTAERALGYEKPLAEWGDKYRRAVHAWRESLCAAAQAGASRDLADAELFAVLLGDTAFVGLNGEVFSRFADWLREGSPFKTYVVGYANGSLGYIPTQAAYAEGGYEVDVAHFFQGHFRLKPGGLETLAIQGKSLLHQLTTARSKEYAAPGASPSS